MTLHIASPVAHPERIRDGSRDLREAFSVVTPYLTSVPLYGGLWMMAARRKRSIRPHCLPKKWSAGLSVAAYPRCSITNGDMHRAALALPNFVRSLVGKG
jgi:spermidine synthase